MERGWRKGDIAAEDIAGSNPCVGWQQLCGVLQRRMFCIHASLGYRCLVGGKLSVLVSANWHMPVTSIATCFDCQKEARFHPQKHPLFDVRAFLRSCLHCAALPSAARSELAPLFATWMCGSHRG